MGIATLYGLTVSRKYNTRNKLACGFEENLLGLSRDQGTDYFECICLRLSFLPPGMCRDSTSS